MAKVDTKKMLWYDSIHDNIEIGAKEYQGIYSTRKTLEEMDDLISDFRIVNNDLLFTVTDSHDDEYTVTVTDYFKENGKSSFNYIVGSDAVFNLPDIRDVRSYVNMLEDGLINNGNIVNAFSIGVQSIDLKDPLKTKIGTTVTGTAFNDQIDLSEFPAAAMEYFKIKGFTINGGDGDDVIRGSVRDDKITGGKGWNAIQIDGTEAFGNDTVNVTKNEILHLGIMTTEFGYYTSVVNGNDVVISVYDTDEEGSYLNLMGTVTVKNGAKSASFGDYGMFLVTDGVALNDDPDNIAGADLYNYGTKLRALSLQSYMEDAELLPPAEAFNRVYRTPGSTTVKGSDAGDMIDLTNAPVAGSKGYTVNLGAGDDVVAGSSGDDTFSAGEGMKTFYFNLCDDNGFGDDTIKLTKNEMIQINFINGYDGDGEPIPAWKGQISKYVDGNDVVIRAEYYGVQCGTITIKDAAKSGAFGEIGCILIPTKDPGTSEIDDGIIGAGTLLTEYMDEHGQWVGHFNTNLNVKGTKVTGSELGDTVIYADAEVDPRTGKGYTIDAKGGNDYIVGSKGDDTITAGAGYNTILFDYNVGFGNDTVVGTKGERTTINFCNLPGEVEFTVDGKDIVAEIYDGINVVNYITFKDAAKSDAAYFGVVYNSEFENMQSLATLIAPTVLTTESKFTGTYVNDRVIIDETNPSKSYNINLGDGTNVLRAEDVSHLAKMTITGGNDADVVFNGASSDSIKLGKGDNFIIAHTQFGDDTVTLTEGENLTVAIAGDVEYSINKNDIQVTSEDGSTMTFKGLAGKNIVGAESSVEVNGQDLVRRQYDTVLTNDNTKFTSTYLGNSITVDPEDEVSVYKNLNVDLSKSAGRNTVHLEGSTGNNTVKGGKSLTKIYDGAGNDNYTMQGVWDEIVFDEADYGENTVKLAQTGRLSIKGDFEGARISDNKKDVELYGENGTVVIKDFAAKKQATVVVNDDDWDNFDNDIDEVIQAEDDADERPNYFLEDYNFVADVWSEPTDKPKSFTGTRLNDVVDASLYTLADGVQTTAKGVTIDAKDGNNTIIGSEYSDTIKAGVGADEVIATTGNDTYTLGGIDANHNMANTVYYNFDGTGFDTDTYNVSSGETLQFHMSGVDYDDMRFEKVGNDIEITTWDNDENSKIVLKNVANGKLDSNVSFKFNDDDPISLWDCDIEIEATSATTNGTYGNDLVYSEKKSNTFVESYNSENGFGVDDIYSDNEKANDTIKFATSDKNAPKFAATDFSYSLDNPYEDVISVTASLDDDNSVTYSREVDELSDLSLTIQDATNKKYTVTANDAESDVLSNKSNNIYLTFADGIDVTSGKKDDIIVSAGGDNLFTYTAGNDMFVGQNGDDTYKIQGGLNKNTALLIKDNGGDYDTLRLGSDMEDAAIFFNVNADGSIDEESDLVIFDKASYTKGKDAAANIGNFPKSAVAISNYFDQGCVENIIDRNGQLDMSGDGFESIGMIENIRQNVAGWLASHENYTDAAAVFASGNNDDMQGLLAVYTMSSAPSYLEAV